MFTQFARRLMLIMVLGLLSACSGGGAFTETPSGGGDIPPSGDGTTTPLPTLPAGATVQAQILNDGQPANGVAAATLFLVARDASGVPLNGMPVSLSFSAGSLAVASASTGLTNASGSFTTDITSLAVGPLTATPIVGGKRQLPLSLSFTSNVGGGGVLPSYVTLSVDKNSVPADGATAITLTVIARDLSGTPLMGVPVVLASNSGSALFSEVSGETGNNGAFITRVTNTVIENVEVNAFAGSVKGTMKLLSFTSGGTTNQQVTSVTSSVQNPNPLANGEDAATLVVYARDAAGGPVPGAAVSIQLSGGSAQLNPESGVTDASGRFMTTLTDQFAESFTATAMVSNVKDANSPTITFRSVTDTSGGTTAAKLALLVTNNNQPANGTDGVSVTAVVRDANNVPVSNVDVRFSSVSNTARLNPASGLTGANGTITSSVADTSVGSFDITAWVASSPDVNASAKIDFVSGGSSTPVASAAVSITDNNRLANGKESMTLTVVAKNSSGTPVAGAPVTLFFVDKEIPPGCPLNCQVISAVPAAASGVTNAGGSFSTTITDTVAETFYVQAKVGADPGVSVRSDKLVFVATSATTPPSKVTISTDRSSALADGSTSIKLTVIARDNFGTPLQNVPVTLSVQNASTTPDPANPDPAGAALLSPATGTTGTDGAFFAELTNTRAGDLLIGAMAGTTSAASITVKFTESAVILPDSVVISVANNNAKADGTDPVTLSVAVRNSLGQPVAGAPVSIRLSSKTGGTPAALFSNQTGASGSTTVNGTFVTTLTSTQQEELGVIASSSGIDSSEVIVKFAAAPSIEAASMQLIASSTQLLSEGRPDGVTLTALLKTQDNNPYPGATVRFSADSGVIQAIAVGSTEAGVTNESGMAQARLTTVGNGINRVITVTATSGAQTQTLQVTVSGTGISITGPTTATLGDTVAFSVFLKDSAGRGVFGQRIAVSSQLGNVLNGAASGTAVTVNTDANGRAEVQLSAGNAGVDLLTAELLPDPQTAPNAVATTGSFSFSIADDNFTVEPTPNADVLDIPLDPNISGPCIHPFCQTFNIHWDKAGQPQIFEQINISATRGKLEPASGSVTTDLSGNATFTIRSNDAGPTTLTVSTATANGPSTQRQYEFVATNPSSITLQANPSTIGVNSPGSNAEQSEIVAVVRDSENNLVKNQRVEFTLTDITGGRISPSSVITDSFGRASTVYIAGSAPSAADGVTVTATVTERPSVSTSVKLTVAQKGVFVSLGTGNTMFEPTETLYEYPYTILVNDINGGPVAGAEVVLSVTSLSYGKGFYRLVEGRWQNVRSITCLSEDLVWDGDPANQNRVNNGLLDPGEDINNNARLEPGNLVTLNPGVVKTDANGLADFKIVYAQENANWLDVRLTAKTVVAGSEGSDSIDFTLAIIASDVSSPSISPPGSPSPFGYGGNVTIITDDADGNGILDTADNPPGPYPIDLFTDGKINHIMTVPNPSCSNTL